MTTIIIIANTTPTRPSVIRPRPIAQSIRIRRSAMTPTCPTAMSTPPTPPAIRDILRPVTLGAFKQNLPVVFSFLL